MSRLVLDAELLAQLRDATKAVEIADEDGIVIGTFVPNASYERIMSFILPEPTKEDLAEARAEGRAELLSGRAVTTAELLARLEEVKRQWEARQ